MAATALRRLAAFVRPRHGRREDVYHRLEPIRERFAHDLAAARRIGAERGEGATTARVVAMAWRQVMLQQCRVRVVRAHP